jgi:hypothetical protein
MLVHWRRTPLSSSKSLHNLKLFGSKNDISRFQSVDHDNLSSLCLLISSIQRFFFREALSFSVMFRFECIDTTLPRHSLPSLLANT